MKHIYFSKKLLLSLFVIFTTGTAFGQSTLQIETGDITLNPGEQTQVSAVCKDSTGATLNVKINWTTDPGYLGKVDKNGVFTAGHAGDGVLVAKYKDLRDTVNLIVLGTPKGEDDEGDETDYPKVKVIPGKIKIAAGDSVELVAFYINELDEKVDTVFSWSVWPAELGMFPDTSKNMFYAGNAGEGFIVASLGDLADTVKLDVKEPKTKPNNSNNSRQMIITPGDTTVSAGDVTQIQYEATYKTNGNKHENAQIQWSISGDSIGTIDENTGLLLLSGETGLALIKAEYSNFSASVELMVVDSLADAVVNTISIHRVLPDGNELPAKTFHEGDSYKIGGLPFPLNILNGGMLHFPFGCIDEDVEIYMFIPEEYAEVDNDSAEVNFSQDIIAGVKFNVKPVGSDTIVEPYAFNIPLNLCLTFKRGLLDTLGVNPENLDVFFADNTGFVTDGTGNVAVDTVKNKIYSSIAHFSTIVVRKQNQQTLTEIFKNNDEGRMLVYPNPFSSLTKIMFKISENSDVNLSIYNTYGQKIKVLVNSKKQSGIYSVNWDGKNENGTLCPTGVYFCTLLLNRDKVEVKRLVLNR